MYAGIDYGVGKTNVDVKTGIRFGVISQNSVTQAWCDSAEADYGEPHCPKCGNEAIAYDEYSGESDDEMDTWDHAEHECDDYVCCDCQYVFGSESAYGDEPAGWTLDDGEYKATDCLDSDIMILSSPYYTLAQYCSPCCPGAGNLDCAMDGGHKTYCFGHDWFDEGKAPYPVYSVETGELVEP